MESPEPARILMVRLGALGDVVHALPAAAALKRSFPQARLAWAIEPRWAVLLGRNPHLDGVLALDIRGGWLAARRELRAARFDLVIDFQGLIKSALVARAAGAARVAGFARELLREKAAGFFYTERAGSSAGHVVDQNLDLAAAAGAQHRTVEFPLPPGVAEGQLPDGDFVLASPAAGWRAKQWPEAHYARLAGLLREQLGWPLVINCAPGEQDKAPAIVEMAPPGSCRLHVSSVAGLVDATRRARAVVGVDSGPLHLAAALGKPGVALFGPTDPSRNGPYGDSFVVLRAAGATTSYKRAGQIAPSMRALDPERVMQALAAQVSRKPVLEPHR